jgi:hypothetical protein
MPASDGVGGARLDQQEQDVGVVIWELHQVRHGSSPQHPVQFGITLTTTTRRASVVMGCSGYVVLLWAEAAVSCSAWCGGSSRSTGALGAGCLVGARAGSMDPSLPPGQVVARAARGHPRLYGCGHLVMVGRGRGHRPRNQAQGWAGSCTSAVSSARTKRWVRRCASTAGAARRILRALPAQRLRGILGSARGHLGAGG